MEHSADIFQVLTNAGPLGAIIAAMGIYVWRLHRQLKDTQDSRVADAQKVVDRVLAINNESNRAITGLTSAVEKLHTLIETIRNGRR